jgi:hypothetical protein
VSLKKAASGRWGLQCDGVFNCGHRFWPQGRAVTNVDELYEKAARQDWHRDGDRDVCGWCHRGERVLRTAEVQR